MSSIGATGTEGSSDRRILLRRRTGGSPRVLSNPMVFAGHEWGPAALAVGFRLPRAADPPGRTQLLRIALRANLRNPLDWQALIRLSTEAKVVSLSPRRTTVVGRLPDESSFWPPAFRLILIRSA